MKTYLIPHMMCVLALLFSCSPEELSIDNVTSETVSINEANIEAYNELYGLYCNPEAFDKIVKIDGKLSFESIEHFGEMLSCLESLVDAHEDNFIDSHPELTADELDDLEQKVGHRQYAPLEVFEHLLD